MVYMYCRRDPSLSVFLAFLGEGIRTHVDMHLSLCLLAIDVIDFLITLESNICHNQSDFLIHLTNEMKIILENSQHTLKEYYCTLEKSVAAPF